MELIDQVLLKSHVLAGALALLTGILCMVTRKGGKNHRRIGKVYFWSMAWVFVSVVLLAIFFRFYFFFFVIAVLSFYAAFSGYRVLFRKRVEAATAVDHLTAYITLAAGIALVAVSVLAMMNLMPTAAITAGASVDTILGLLFGGMTAASAVNELRLMRTPQADRRWWWYHHMDRMLSSYVAAMTAFMVQMGVRLAPPEIAWIFWVAPSAIGVPLIAYWKMWYRRQFEQARVDGTAVTQS
jgi:uncharacterized membrane protein